MGILAPHFHSAQQVQKQVVPSGPTGWGLGAPDHAPSLLVYVDISVGRNFLPGLATIVNFSRKILSPTDYPVYLADTARDKNIMAILNDTHRFLHFNLTHTGTEEDNHYVDIGKLLSEANRRSYRQGMVYHIANIVFDDAQGDADIDVCIMPNNWTTQAAWQAGFRHWLLQQQAAMSSLGHAELGAWSDYKIHLNADSISDVDQATLIDVNGNTFATGDWDYSKYIVPNDGGAAPTDCTITMMGEGAGAFPAVTRVSLLQALEQSILAPQSDPNLDSNSEYTLWSLLSDQASSSEVLTEVIKDLEADNDLPPYDVDVIQGARTAASSGRPSSPWVARTCMIKGGASTSSPVAAVGGFAAPCGLLMIETNSSVNGNSIGVTIELVPGEYKGVHAYPMRGGGF